MSLLHKYLSLNGSIAKIQLLGLIYNNGKLKNKFYASFEYSAIAFPSLSWIMAR